MIVYQLQLNADHQSTPGFIIQEIDPRLFKNIEDAKEECVELNKKVFEIYNFDSSECREYIESHPNVSMDDLDDEGFDTMGSYDNYDCSSLPYWDIATIDTDKAI
jgi:hypothetical protein